MGLLCSFFLILHSLGDFYFQSNRLSERKRNSYAYVALHGLIYLLVSLICVLPFWSVPLLISAGALSACHFAVDSVKFLCLKAGKIGPNARVYVVDQLVHLICIAGIASAQIYLGNGLFLLPPIREYAASILDHPESWVPWVGLLLMAFKPANVTIKQLVARYRPAKKKGERSNRAGAFIGSLERLIILLLLSAGQYSAIGLVLTAKSVARYNLIAKDRQFAEYYLLGTLLSTLYAIGTYFLFLS